MKTAIQVGKRYKVAPKAVIGMDGGKYDVFSFSVGRGWEETQRYAVCEGQTAVIEVEIIRIVVRKTKKRVAECRILNKSAIDGIKILTFAKKPYVRKDGTFKVCRDSAYNTLGAIDSMYENSNKIDILVSENIFTEI